MKTYIGWQNTRQMAKDLVRTIPIHTGEWQAMDTRASVLHATHELQDVTFRLYVPVYQSILTEYVKPDLPWADDHFAERVSGIPHNPPPSAASWPYAVRGHADHTDTMGRFDHTYPERFWPRWSDPERDTTRGRQGIRFRYGDLSDVVELLRRSPYTRQAYLPVWFPEDTGAVDGQRVPCTLGYHFMIRDGELSCRYYIRSCDMLRHFHNDVYFACRLTQWIVERLQEQWSRDDDDMATIHLTPGTMTMYISSLHCFVGDVARLGKRYGQ